MVDPGGLLLYRVAASMARGVLLGEWQPVLQISEGGSQVGVTPGAHHCLQQQDCLLCLLTSDASQTRRPTARKRLRERERDYNALARQQV